MQGSFPFYFIFYQMVIDLKTFIEGYKTSEVIHGDLRWKFREPRLKDLDKPVMEILEIGCIE